MIAMSSSVSCGVSTAVGSSKTSTFASRDERLDDLDPLLHADREVFDEGVGVDVEAEPGGDLAHLRARRVEVEAAAELGRLVARA